MDTIKVKKSIEPIIEFTPAEVATMFCDMDEFQQAEFFNVMARNMAMWKHHYVFQLQRIVDVPDLTSEAKALMRNIGDYAQTV